MEAKLVLERARREQRGLTFNDVSLRVAFSEVLPEEADLRSRFSRNVSLKIPFVSAAMDTITEHALAIELGMLGGIGVIHKNLSIEQQVEEARKVKDHLDNVKGAEGRDPDLFNVDSNNRLRVGAAVGVGEEAYMRAQRLIEAGVDVIVIDTAHGNSKNVVDTLRRFKGSFAIDVVVGNIGYEDAVERLIGAGADGLKVGIGPGTICTTRVIAGVGEPQVSAVYNCAREAYRLVGDDVPICADGGIKYSGDVPKIIAAGAHSVMMGGVFAGTDETPGEIIKVGKVKYKVYRGMGSLAAMKEGKGARDRYFHSEVESDEELVPEGVEGLVLSKGPLAKIVHQYVGGLCKGMGYAGTRTIDELRKRGDFTEVTGAGAGESHPSDHLHDVKASPNYEKE